jgi:predicted XRE-type DNA-binding protein
MSPSKKSEPWQDFLSPAELALYNSDPENYVARFGNLDETIETSDHPYANVHQDPVGREGNVEFEGAMHSPSTPDPNRQKYLMACLEFTDGCSELEVKCHFCGKRLPSRSPRLSVAVWDNDEDTDELASKLIVYCIGCLELPHPVADTKLTTQQRRIRYLIGEGWSQDDIAEELGISQPTVSRLWKQSFM